MPPQRAMSRTVHSPPSGSALLEGGDGGVDRVRLDLADRVVEAVLGEVDAHPAGEEGERRLVVGVALELVVLGPGLLLGLVDDRRQQGVDAGVVGVAADLDHAPADVADDLFEDLLGRRRGEDRLGVLGGELAAAGGGARLVDHRRALWRGLAEVDPGDLEELALVGDPVDLRGVGEDPGGAVADDGVVLPAALPELVTDLEVLVGDVVAVVVGHLGGLAEVAGAAVEVGGDDVPADAAVGEVVERRHPGGRRGRGARRKSRR